MKLPEEPDDLISISYAVVPVGGRAVIFQPIADETKEICLVFGG